MSANTPEGQVKKKIDAILKPYKTEGLLWYTKTAGSMFGTNGVPDYVCHMRSRAPYAGVVRKLFFTIEAKAGKGKPTDLQLVQMAAITEAGGMCLVINEDNLHELPEFLRAHS